MSYIGTTKIGKMFLGTTEIAKAYLGTDLVFQNGGSPTPPPGPVIPYTQVEYIQSSANKYINTNIEVNLIRRYITHSQFNVATSAKAEGSTQTNLYLFIGQNAQKKFYCARGSSVVTTSITNDGNFHDFDIDIIAGTFKVDNTSTSISTGAVNSAIKFALFACNGVEQTEGNYSYYVQGKKGRTTLYGSDGNVLADLYPVRDGQSGYFYDTISQSLLGDGTFTPGPDLV